MPKHDHDPDYKPKSGPKERELAVSLTVAVLAAANVSGSLPEIEEATLGLYARMLSAVSKPAPSASSIE